MKEQDSDKTLSPRDWDPLLKKIVGVCWFVNSVKSRRWQEDGLTLTVQIIRMRPNLFVYLSMCKWLCGLSTLRSSGTRQHIFSRDSWAMAQKLCYWWMSTSLGGLDQGPLGTIGCIAGEPHHESNLPKVAKEE